MALRKSLSIPSRGARAASKRSPVTVTVEDVISHAVAKAQGGEVIYAADYLENKATGVSPQVALKLLLAAAQLIDSTNPNRAKGILQRVLEIDPKCGPGHLGLAVVLSNLGDSRGSIERLRDAILLPLTAAQKILASVMLSKYGLLAPALDMAKKAFYELGKPLGQASNCLDIALQVADWDFVEELILILTDAHRSGRVLEANESTKTNILWCDDEGINLEVIKAWSNRSFPKIPRNRKAFNQNPKDRRLRVGYLSSDYRSHPTSYLVNGLLRNHDKSEFELFMYCSGWDDGSDIRKQIVSNFEHTYSVANLDDEKAAKLIDEHNLDVLVELNGPTKANRMGILAYRPAPLQICYLGWPGSAGGRFVDYVIADDYILPPERAALYPEKIIWLSGSYQVNDYGAKTLDPAPTKASLGFSADTLVIGMFNSINKVRREVWQVWMGVLRDCPNTVLWVLDPGADARENLARETSRAGVALDRVVIAPKLKQAEHLSRLQVCDLMLDPWPIGGHTTTSDALAAKVPVLTLEGKNYSSRVSGGLLKACGLQALVMSDKEEYTLFAKQLLKDPLLLAAIKKLVSDAVPKCDLFNSLKTTQEIELAYKTLVYDLWETQNA